MIPPAASTFSSSEFVLTAGSLLLAPLAIAGVALVSNGLGRSRSAAQSLLGSLLMASVAAIVFALIGSAFADGFSGSGHIVRLYGKPWNWAGTGPVALSGMAHAQARAQLSVLFELLAVALTVLIPWSSGADRWRLTSGVASAGIVAALVFPVAAHWIWGGGWLSQLGINFALGTGFLDAGGGGAIHVLGGLSALAVVWIVGSRRGKFPREGLSTAIPGHNAPFVLFGCLVALVGWLAWNFAGALLWLNAGPSILPVTAVNTVLSAAAALAATFGVTHYRFGKPDASLCANGWLAGLVASSSCASLITPLETVFTGAIAGVLTPLLVEFLELAVSIDDPSGAISVHAASGIWGLLAVGIFASQPGQFLAQLVGIAALLGLVLPLMYLLYALVNRIIPFRVDPDGERIGMDLHELGGGAYPEFVVHRDDSYR
jgi:ammonium transporter, Amt family